MRFLAAHGGCHGAWAWDFVKPELAKLGHELVAVELPGHGTRRDEVATLDGYRDAVLELLQPGDVLVGHSSGSVVATIAANERPDLVAHICFVAGILPVEGMPLPYETTSTTLGGSSDSPVDDESPLDTYIKMTEGNEAFYFERQGAVMAFYNDCSDELIDWAYSKLVPEPFAPLTVPVFVPNFWKQADLSRSFIMGSRDTTCFPALARLQAKRLGVVPLEIDTGHSPWLSRPTEFAALLVEATKTKPVGPLIPTSLHVTQEVTQEATQEHAG
ncbi:alpha/beta hydrolase [Thermopolyspora sp. NPDC052614]|uniref:alpha/beta fold hydrolase n=1 Tax=Thermopolyspora sp. NPDC052614 TaxID=3155682 RepID=UPI003445BCB8